MFATALLAGQDLFRSLNNIAGTKPINTGKLVAETVGVQRSSNTKGSCDSVTGGDSIYRCEISEPEARIMSIKHLRSIGKLYDVAIYQRGIIGQVSNTISATGVPPVSLSCWVYRLTSYTNGRDLPKNQVHYVR